MVSKLLNVNGSMAQADLENVYVCIASLNE